MARLPEETLEALGGLKKLSPTEREFMQIIWAHPEGISSEVIYQQFPQARGTKSTILYNICEKGYAENRQEGRHHFYTACISETDYEKALIRQQLKKSFGDSSFERLVAAFCGTKTLSERQSQKINALLQELEEELKEDE